MATVHSIRVLIPVWLDSESLSLFFERSYIRIFSKTVVKVLPKFTLNCKTILTKHFNWLKKYKKSFQEYGKNYITFIKTPRKNFWICLIIIRIINAHKYLKFKSDHQHPTSRRNYKTKLTKKLSRLKSRGYLTYRTRKENIIQFLAIATKEKTRKSKSLR